MLGKFFFWKRYFVWLYKSMKINIYTKAFFKVNVQGIFDSKKLFVRNYLTLKFQIMVKHIFLGRWKESVPLPMLLPFVICDRQLVTILFLVALICCKHVVFRNCATAAGANVVVGIFLFQWLSLRAISLQVWPDLGRRDIVPDSFVQVEPVSFVASSWTLSDH